MTETGKVAWLQAMPITCHRCRRIWWSQPMGNMPAARLPHSMVHWFQTSGSRGDDGTSHFGSRNVPQLWVGFDPFVRLILLLFINIDGYFRDLVSHFGVYVIQWFENQQMTAVHNQTSRQLKDLQPCHVQIDGLPRLNSKASGCGPQPTAHWNL